MMTGIPILGAVTCSNNGTTTIGANRFVDAATGTAHFGTAAATFEPSLGGDGFVPVVVQAVAGETLPLFPMGATLQSIGPGKQGPVVPQGAAHLVEIEVGNAAGLIHGAAISSDANGRAIEWTVGANTYRRGNQVGTTYTRTVQVNYGTASTVTYIVVALNAATSIAIV